MNRKKPAKLLGLVLLSLAFLQLSCVPAPDAIPTKPEPLDPLDQIKLADLGRVHEVGFMSRKAPPEPLTLNNQEELEAFRSEAQYFVTPRRSRYLDWEKYPQVVVLFLPEVYGRYMVLSYVKKPSGLCLSAETLPPVSWDDGSAFTQYAVISPTGDYPKQRCLD